MRQFLAIELPGTVHAELAALLGGLRGALRGWRWVPPANVHLTLRFLGEVSAEVDAQARARWRAVAEGARPFRLGIGGLGCFPPGGRPRVLWVGVREEGEGERMARLAAELEHAARGVGFEPEEREFRPHLTIARALRGERATRPVGSAELEGVDCREIVLFRSELAPTGARYSVVERFPFGSGEDRRS